MTDQVNMLSIELVPVPANMTHFVQPLDLMVNRAAKNFTKQEFISYYSSAIQQGLDEGKALEDIEVDPRLAVLNHYMHRGWSRQDLQFFSQLKKVDRLS